jgi:hypothetical protein
MKTLYNYNPQTMQYIPVKIRPFREKLMIAFFIFLCFIGLTGLAPNNPIQYITAENELIVVDSTPEFSPKVLKETLHQLNIKHPDIVYAQALLETGNFTSTIFKENNNLFGMKEARVRATTNRGTNLGHATYMSWYESVIDYGFYQSRYLGKLTRAQYFDYLGKNYAEDPNYVSKIKNIIKKHNLK